MAKIDAVKLPTQVASVNLRSTNAVVIDILRATTTIVTGIEAGASGIMTTGSIEQGFEIAKGIEGVLLGGERSAVRIQGFDLGNSPLEYTPDAVRGRVIVLSTTNGTRAFELVGSAAGVLAGALTNREAIAGYLRRSGLDVLLVCSGTDGKVSEEDCFGAGMIADLLDGWGTLTDRAAMMRDEAKAALDRHGDPATVIGSSFHGRRLAGLGLQADIRAAGRMDSASVVPVLDAGGMLVAAG